MSEEAAALLSDFVQTLDNLPAEVKHLLYEVEKRDGMAGELMNRSMNRQIALQRMYRNQGTYTDPKEAGIEDKARADVEQAVNYSKEKVILTQRAKTIVKRHLDRLQKDIDKLEAVSTLVVPHMEIQPPPPPSQTSLPGVDMGTNLSSSSSSSRLPSPALGRLDADGSASSGTTTTSNKKRKTNALANSTSMRSGSSPLSYPPTGVVAQQQQSSSSNLPPPAITPFRSSTASSASSRKQNNSNINKKNKKHVDEEDEESNEVRAALSGRGASAAPPIEDDEDIQEGADDQTLYCLCQRVSYGEMIGCDNPNCPYEWFHYSCVGLKNALPENTSWYCPHCRDKMQKNARSGNRR